MPTSLPGQVLTDMNLMVQVAAICSGDILLLLKQSSLSSLPNFCSQPLWCWKGVGEPGGLGRITLVSPADSGLETVHQWLAANPDQPAVCPPACWQCTMSTRELCTWALLRSSSCNRRPVNTTGAQFPLCLWHEYVLTFCFLIVSIQIEFVVGCKLL